MSRTTTASWQRRLQGYLVEFEDAGVDAEQGEDVQTTLAAYLPWSRRASGFRMALALIEYAEGLKLPDAVFDAPVLTHLRQDTLDIVLWMHVRRAHTAT